MLHKLLASGVLAVAVAAPAHAARARRLHRHRGPPPGSSGGLYSLGPILATGTVGGARERVTDLEREVSATATAVGITERRVADQTFRYDSRLVVPKSSAGGVKATFTLSRPADVTLQVETSLGTIVETEASVSLDTGAQSLSWDGTTPGGARAPAGSYVVRVTAVGAVGTSDLSTPFALRR